ncbi:MAG: GNAT family N-acetyltransferase [Sphingomonadales bacterium]|nr:GNAT family N-acetyltransferase [Sphingomonadales bacterium]
MADSVETTSAVMPTADLSRIAREYKWVRYTESRSGRKLHLRPACPADIDGLRAMFAHVRPDDLRHRFLTGLRQVNEDQLRDMVRDDRPDAVNFLALDRLTGDVLAAAMLAREGDGAQGEFALATRTEARAQGISWTLLEHLLEFAEVAGMTEVNSIETWDDHVALQLEREMGFAIHRDPDDATLMIATRKFGRDA